MKKYGTALITVVATITITFLLPPAAGLGQADAEKAKARAAQRARGIALQRQYNTQTLRLYDRSGKLVATLNERVNSASAKLDDYPDCGSEMNCSIRLRVPPASTWTWPARPRDRAAST